MGKDFKPTLTQINTIGEELKFQREYHNFKEPNNKYTTQYGNGKTSRTISEVLEEYMNANCEDYGSIDEKNSRNGYGEVSTKENVISAIEKGKVRGKNRKDFTYETYYLRMYCLFKIYGFLEDYEILRLFYKYKIGEPKMEKSRKFIQKVREECFEQYKKNKLKSATFLYGNREEMVDILYMRESEEKKHGVYYMVGVNQESILLRDTIKKYTLGFPDPQEYLPKIIEKCKKTRGKVKRKCLSLEIGKETSFIDEVLEGKIKYITYETLIRMITVLGIKDEKLLSAINKEFSETSKEENFIFNKYEIQNDIFKFKEMWNL